MTDRNPIRRFTRDTFAVNVLRALNEYFPWNYVSITLGKTTSDCPLICVDLGDEQVFHVTITRARR